MVVVGSDRDGRQTLDPRSTAQRRRHVLAYLDPIFDLHLYRHRNPSDIDFEDYDFIGLTQFAVDTVAISAGFAGEDGASRERVVAETANVAAQMVPGRPSSEHVTVAERVLDYLLRHGEPSSYFDVQYADPDRGWQTTWDDRIRVLYETLSADGSTVLLHADRRAVMLLLVATNRSLEDEHEATMAVMRAQVDSGRLGDAVESALDAKKLSQTYAANMRRLLAEAERDVARVDYVGTLEPEIAKAEQHVERRITADGSLRLHLDRMLADTSEERDPEEVRQIARASGSLREATVALESLHSDLVRANPRWRDAQAAQAFTFADVTQVDPVEDVLNAMLSGGSPPAGAGRTPPDAGLTLSFTEVVDRLTRPKKEVPVAEPRDADDELVELGGAREQFPEEFHAAAAALRERRVPPGSKARLSEVLDDADELVAADADIAVALRESAGGPEVARRRLRLLVALDALMLWRADGDAGIDGWGADDDGTRADLDDLDVPDLVVWREVDDERA